MTKRNIILLTVFSVLPVCIYWFFKTHDFAAESSTVLMVPQDSSVIINSEALGVKEFAENTNNQSTVQTSRVKKRNTLWPVNCVVVSDEEAQYLDDLFRKIANEYVLTPFDVDDHLKMMNEAELIAEFEAGEKAAAFVLGLHYSFNFFSTSWYNPLIRDVPSEGYTSLESIDTKALAKAREWLWTAAVNGVPIALLWLGDTFIVEHGYLERSLRGYGSKQLSNAELNKLRLLKANEFAYKKLLEEVAPDMDYFVGASFETYTEKFEKIKFEKKTDIYQDIYKKWSADRDEKGESILMELNMPEHIKQQLIKMHNLCRS